MRSAANVRGGTCVCQRAREQAVREGSWQRCACAAVRVSLRFRKFFLVQFSPCQSRRHGICHNASQQALSISTINVQETNGRRGNKRVRDHTVVPQSGQRSHVQHHQRPFVILNMLHERQRHTVQQSNEVVKVAVGYKVQVQGVGRVGGGRRQGAGEVEKAERGRR